MKIKYFKTKTWGGSYVAREDYMNIVSISKIDFCNMANDENNFEGAYQNMGVSEEEFEELKEFANNKNREKGINLIRKIHEDNKESLEKNPLYAKHTDGSLRTCVPFKWSQYYNSTKKILE